MNQVTEDMKNLLVSASVGSFGASTGWTINVGVEPVKPTTAITLYDTGGSQPGYTFDNSIEPVRGDQFQIRVRSKDYKDGYAKILECVKVLAQVGMFSVSNVLYHNIFQMSEIASIGQNESNQFIWTVNMKVVREEN